MLIVVLQAALMVFMGESGVTLEELSANETARSPFWADTLIGLGTALYGIILTMLYLGFLKSSAVQGISPQQPMDLLRFGRLYFWKIFLFQFLLVIFLWIFSGSIILVLGGLIWKTDDVTKYPEWLFLICLLATVAFMMKPALFIPARIIVYNDSVLRAIMAMRRYRIKDVDYLYGLIAGLVGIVVLFLVLFGLVTEKTVLYYTLSGICYPILTLMSLWLTLTVVMWVQEQLEIQQAQNMERQSQE